MVRVQRNFVVVQYVEVAVIIICAGVALAQKHRVLTSGIGLGLLIHAAVLLAFDVVAERRGAVYLEALRQPASGSNAPRAEAVGENTVRRYVDGFNKSDHDQSTDALG